MEGGRKLQDRLAESYCELHKKEMTDENQKFNNDCYKHP